MKTELLDGKPCGVSIRNPDIHNPAIDRCCDAWKLEYDTERAAGRGIVSSGLRANEAFRTAMPPLNSMKDISDFLACATYGMTVGAIGWPAGDLLIKAARVALRLHRRPRKSTLIHAKSCQMSNLTSNLHARAPRKNKKTPTETV